MLLDWVVVVGGSYMVVATTEITHDEQIEGDSSVDIVLNLEFVLMLKELNMGGKEGVDLVFYIPRSQPQGLVPNREPESHNTKICLAVTD
jgi:hypothetical protein